MCSSDLRNITRAQKTELKRNGKNGETINPNKLFLMFPEDIPCHPHNKFPNMEIHKAHGALMYIDPKTWTAVWDERVERTNEYQRPDRRGKPRKRRKA